MFERTAAPQKMQRALLVGVARPGQTAGEAESLLRELRELVETLAVEVVQTELVKLRESHGAHLVGSGKAVQLIDLAKELGCDSIVFDEELTPAQQRNWEADSGLVVLDRHEVILDIFARRARTREATLQVELAQMEYALPRLQRAWGHLDRQRGGGTGLRGVGESQLEIDSRLVRQRIARLKREIAEVVSHRATQRKQRQRTPVPTAAIVGYTNAGKSSLLNRLTQAGVLAVDQLFATLDPTTRRLTLPSGRHLLLTDTVGFVRRLPHGLVEAFKATLEEAVQADFLLHVVDAASPERESQAATTLAVLKELGVKDKTILTVHNKLDLLADEDRAQLLAKAGPNDAPLSVATGEGLDGLLSRLDGLLAGGAGPSVLLIPHQRWELVGKLRAAGAVQREEARDDGVLVFSQVPGRLLAQVREFILSPAAIAALGHLDDAAPDEATEASSAPIAFEPAPALAVGQ